MSDAPVDRIPRRRQRWTRGDEPEFGRFAFFTDAVFAIALTLLVLDIRIDTIQGNEDSIASMWTALKEIQPNVIAFGVAFILLGKYWLGHHAFVGRLGAIDSRLLGLNLVYLAFVALLPFPSSLVGEHEGNPLSVIVYAIVLAIISGMETVLFVYAHRAHLLRDELDRDQYKWEVIGSLSPVVMFLITVPLALVWPSLTLLSWIALGPIFGRAMRYFAPDSVSFD